MDCKRLLPRLLDPERPQLTDTQAVLEGSKSPVLAWKQLAKKGVIPRAWQDSPHRRFADTDAFSCEACSGLLDEEEGMCDACGATGADRRFPPDLTACLALASSVSAVAEAEAAARATAACLRELGFHFPTGPGGRDVVIWRCTPSGELVTREAETFYLTGWAEALIRRSRDDLRVPAPRNISAIKDFEELVLGELGLSHLLRIFHAWQWLGKRGARVKAPGLKPTMPRTFLRRPLAEIPNPLAGIIAIWELGFAFDTITDAGVMLVAPEVGWRRGIRGGPLEEFDA